MIKCSLIEITNDNRAVICVGEGEDGEVRTTEKLKWVNYVRERFSDGKKEYDFSGFEWPDIIK